MLALYLKAAWRNAVRTPLHSLLNLLGLSLGLATFIVVMLFTDGETHFYRHFANHADLYMVRMGTEQYGQRAVTNPEPANTLAQMQLDFPGIDGVTRSTPWIGVIENGEQVFPNLLYDTVDPNFIEVVGVPLLRGDPHTALDAPDSVAIDATLARAVCGSLDCLGHILTLNQTTNVRVTAVFPDMPDRDGNKSRMLLSGSGENSPIGKLAKLDSGHTLPPNYIASYLLIRSPEARARIEAGLEQFGHRHYKYFIDSMKAYFVLMPLDSWRLQGKKYGDQDSHPLIRLLATNAVGLLVLAVATLNYVNLATALASRRGVEIGVRKAIGGSRSQLIVQILVESMALSAVATLVAVAIVELLLPAFNAIWYTTLHFDYLHQPRLLLMLAALAIGYGLLAGAYPALVMARGRPAAALRSGRLAHGANWLRQALVLLQYAVSISMIIAAGVIYQQYRYATDLDGIDKNLVYEVWAPPPEAGVVSAKENIIERLLPVVEAIPGVKAVGGIAHGEDWNYRRPDRQFGSAKIQLFPVGPQVFEFWGIKPLAGRLFDKDHTDSDSIILNETAVREFGFATPDAAIGQEIVAELADGSKPPRRYTIIAVTPDFFVGTIYGKIPPRVSVIAPPSSYDELSIKLSGRQVPETVAAIEKAFKDVAGRRLHESSFLDAIMRTRFDTMLHDAETIGGFSLLAMFVAALGLFSLAEFLAERRTKEIGIRKAMGASSPQIAGLLTRDFLWPAAAANLIAWPLAYICMTRWLGGFAYHTDFALWLLPAASLLVLAVAGLTVALHVFKVARARPVTALRYE